MNERQFLHFTRTYQYQREEGGNYKIFQLDPLDKSTPSAERKVSNVIELVGFVFECENKLGVIENACEMMNCLIDVFEQLNYNIKTAQAASI